MPQAADPPAKLLRTWRPMAAWSAGIVLALGLAWLICAVAAPAWQVHRVLADEAEMVAKGRPALAPSPVDRLGGKATAARKLDLYLRLPKGLARYKRGALALLAGCGPAGVGPVLRTLGSPDDDLRARAFALLFRIGLELRPEEMREERVKGRAFVTLLAGGAHDRSAQVRDAVVYGLKYYEASRAGTGQPPRPEVSRALVALLADPDEGVRLHAVDAGWMPARVVFRTDDPAVIAALAQMLADPSANVRRGAVESLGGSGRAARPTLPALKRLKTDPDEGVRASAGWALEEIEGGGA
jgi:HEAT repeat protein